MIPLKDYLSVVLKYKEVSGREFQPRVYTLDFDLLEPSKRNRKPEFSYRSISAVLKNAEKNPLLVLTTVSEHLKILNRYKVSCPSRLRHLEVCTQFGYRAIQEVYDSFLKKEEFPESQERRQALVSAIKTIKGLATGYKLVFQYYYSLPDKMYYALEDRIQTLGFKIMELIYLEQYLDALRYQKLPEQTWRDCSQLFFALYKSGMVGKEQNLNQCLRSTRDDVDKVSSSHINIQQLYVLIQLIGLMDVTSWPFALLSKIEAYIFETGSCVSVEIDNGGQLKQGNLIIYNEQICPPLFDRLDTGIKDALLIDITEFDKYLREKYDYITISNQKKEDELYSINLSPDSYDELNLVDKMLNKLHFISRSEARNYVNQYSELQLFFGFRECFKFVRDLADRDYDLLNSGISLKKTLAQQSSQIVSRQDVQQENHWYIINESQGGIHLRLQETQHTPVMFIGQLVVTNLQEEGTNNFDVGYVSRIHRGRGDAVEITIIKIGKEAESVGLQDEHLKQKGEIIPSLLVKGFSGQEIVILYSKQQVYLDSSLYILWKNDVQSLQLGQKRLKLPEIVAFDVADYSPE